MRVHYIQHVPFEGLGSIEKKLLDEGHKISATRVYSGEEFPLLDQFDHLIVMGGPMGVYDENKFDWIAHEKNFIQAAIEDKKPVLGICLGAQFIADALGATISKNKYKEIGWFPLTINSALNKTRLAGAIPEDQLVFHWHGDTFGMPAGAVPLASSEACANQGFVFDNRVIGFQFHLETTEKSAKQLIENAESDLEDAPYVANKSDMLADPEKFRTINLVMSLVLDRFLSKE